MAPPPGLEAARDLADLLLVESYDELASALERATAIFVWDFRTQLVHQAWEHARRVGWIHAGSVGVDAVLNEAIVASDVVVTNTRGVFERPIAEYVLGLVVLFAKDIPRTLRLQSEHQWFHRETEAVRGHRVLVLGAGPIGREIVQVLRAVGMDVTIVGRRARDAGPELGRIHGSDELDRLLPRTRTVVVALPLNEGTHHLIDKRRLGLLQPGARLVNIGRGAVINEAAVFEALRSGHLAAAALDVFESEPLPPDHPFWAMDQVLVSPHMSGDVVGWREGVVDRFVENLARFVEGLPLVGVVDKLSQQVRPAAEPVVPGHS